MNTTDITVPAAFDPYRRLDVEVNGFTVAVEAPDGLSVTCAPWSPRNPGGVKLGVEDYRYTVSQRLSGERCVGPFGGTPRRAPTDNEIHVARRAVVALLRAMDEWRPEGCYRMILGSEVTPHIETGEWRFVPSFWNLRDAATAIADGRVAAEDVASSGPETDVVRALRAAGRLIAHYTDARTGGARDTFLCKLPDGKIVVAEGLAAAHEVLTHG